MVKNLLLAYIRRHWHLASNKPVPTFEENKSGIYKQRNKLAQVKKKLAQKVQRR